MGMATPDQLAELRSATGTEADCLFLELMTRHHRGANPMAEAVVELGSDARVDTVAEGMIAAQTGEIGAMEVNASRMGCAGSIQCWGDEPHDQAPAGDSGHRGHHG